MFLANNLKEKKNECIPQSSCSSESSLSPQSKSESHVQLVGIQRPLILQVNILELQVVSVKKKVQVIKYEYQ